MPYWGLFLGIFFLLIVLVIRKKEKLRRFSFALYVLAALSFAFQYPAYITVWGSFETKRLIVPLLQIIMFGMGTTMGLKDFKGVIEMPKGILIGLICQFTVMPLVGVGLAYSFVLPSEIAAGIILIGSCPGGLASNVMAYLARANIALSISLTTVATLISPFLTPFLMQFLSGTLVPINTADMMISILKMVILPVVLGLFFNQLFKRQITFLLPILPKVSMAAILLIIVIITANGRDALLSVGILLILAAVIHNLAGYFIGYWSCKLLRLPEADCRTIAFEVGMQNGGLASGIAVEMGRISTLGLASVIFGPWMNISGSTLALWWKEKTDQSKS